MNENWILNSARTVGRSHIREGLPCQDSVRTEQKNGVSVIALSDGCGSAPMAEYGSELTVNALCQLLTEQFDQLYQSDDRQIKGQIVTAIENSVTAFLNSHKKLLTEFSKKQPQHYPSFLERWKGYRSAPTLYPLTLFDATVQFVAVKDEKVMMGRLGDGVIGQVRNGALKLVSSEDKVGIAKNATYYPSLLLLTEENPTVDLWEHFEIIKDGCAGECSLFLLASDGVGDVICGEDLENSEKFLFPDEIIALAQVPDRLYEVLEEQYKPLEDIYDDLSIALLQRETVTIDRIILREYDSEGRTVANSFEQAVSLPAPERHDSFSLNLLDAFAAERVERYFSDIGDEEYRAFFVEQASKLLRKLESTPSLSFDEAFRLLQPFIDEDDWLLLRRQFSILELFDINEDDQTVKAKE